MKGAPGFVVKVVPCKDEQISYHSNGERKTLSHEDEFIGYFWQILTERNGVACHLANITRIIPSDDLDSKLFHYADEAWFEMSDIRTTIIALRGPRSNNRFLPPKYKAFEVWDVARNEIFSDEAL